jgi:hypothetical protein
MLIREALYVGMQAIPTHFRAVVILQDTIHLALLAVAQQHYTAGATRRRSRRRTVTRRGDAIIRKTHEFAVAPN